jgi:hypothetical protein
MTSLCGLGAASCFNTKIVGYGVNAVGFIGGKFLLIECVICKSIRRQQMPWILRKATQENKNG